MACLFLAGKVEESPRFMRHIVHTGHHVQHRLSRAHEEQDAEETILSDTEYAREKNEVIKAERRVLKELGFCVHLKHPHKVGLLVDALTLSLFVLSLSLAVFFLQFLAIRSSRACSCNIVHL